jgi:hypothetical protein
MKRCKREIVAIEEQLRAGHSDVEGLLLALMDWSAELRILEAQRKKPPGASPAAGEDQLYAGQPLM